ncbi:MAG: VOC family protein [Thermoplasmata archaeon]
MLKKVDHVVVFVSDMSRAIKFYTQTLGIPLKFESEGWSELATEGVWIGLHESNLSPEDRSKNEGMRVVFRVDDVEEAYRELKTKGVTLTREPEVINPHTGERLAELMDTEGNRISIYGK